MRERTLQTGCSKHGPQDICGHTDDTCPDNQRVDTSQPYSPENNQTEGEILPKKGEWIEVSTESMWDMAYNLHREFEQQMEKDGFKVFYGHGRFGNGVVSKTIESIFRNGLKERDLVKKIGGFNVRFVDPPQEVYAEERVISAAAYELSVFLKPRYEKDGASGYYNFTFIIKARLMSDGDYNQRTTTEEKERCIYVTTVADTKSRSRVQRQVERHVEDTRTQSRNRWEDAKRSGIMNAVSGGLPGLGKKR